MIEISLTAKGSTVLETLTNLQTALSAMLELERQGRRGGTVMLDGSIRPIFKGGKEIAHVTANGSTVDALIHYTSNDKLTNLHRLVKSFNDGTIDKFEFYRATMGYSVKTIAIASGIDPEVIKDRRRYLRQLAKQS